LNLISCAVVASFLFSGALLSGQIAAQNAPGTSSPSVSFYQLRHKSVKQARRFCDEATVELKKHNYLAGLKLLQRALSIDADYWVAQNNLGFAFLHLHRHEDAQKAFQRAIEIDPMNPIGYANLSVAALSRNDFALAEQSASQSMRLDPEMPEARAMLGLALAGQGKWTPKVRKLLEESRSVPTSEALLEKWPPGGGPGPAVIVNASDFL
jgi:tetratricopeptide (TPR) repeat protein